MMGLSLQSTAAIPVFEYKQYTLVVCLSSISIEWTVPFCGGFKYIYTHKDREREGMTGRKYQKVDKKLICTFISFNPIELKFPGQ